MNPIRLYGIPNCDSVKRARAELAARGAPVLFHDFKKAGLPADRLPAWLAAVGRERLLNRQGTTWRQLDEAQRALADSDAGTSKLLRAQPSLVRRPLIEWPDGRISVGLDALRET